MIVELLFETLECLGVMVLGALVLGLGWLVVKVVKDRR
jgi:hypothetical protein